MRVFQAWEMERAQAVATATRSLLADGVDGVEIIPPAAPGLELPEAFDRSVRANAYATFEGLKIVQPWYPLNFETGWLNLGGAAMTAAAYLDGVRVHLRGRVQFIPGVLTLPIAYLVAGHKPQAVLEFIVRGGAGGACYVNIYPDGLIEFHGPLADANTSVSLDGLSFDVRG